MEEDSKDLNTEVVPEGTGQPETTEETPSVEELQERLKKTEEERDNYKTGLLKYKKTEKTLEPKKEELEQEDENPDWDEDSQKFQTQTLSKAEKVAQKAAESVYQKSNEKQAIGKFLEQHPEFQDDENWKEIISNYHPKSGKDSVTNIVKDLERARVSVLYDKGDLDKLSEEAEKRGKQRGYAEGMHADLMTSGGTRQKSNSSKDKGDITEGARQMAERFKIDPKKLALEDDSNKATISF
jgi:hypothetical protein